uniref:HTH three-helical bundle domain-containing protein n=1 Tax=Solanum tuberosum TaxID=4113 RepID=M1C6T9_SOLTU
MREAFPSNGEREVASALLLLSAISPSPLPKSNSIIEISHKVALSNSNSALDSDSNSNLKSKSSASSILTSVNCSFTEARSQSRRMKMIAAFHEQIVKLKVVRQRRSKSFFISDCRQMSSGKPAKATTSRTTFCRSTMVSASASSSSCVSTDSVFSGITSAQSLAADRVIRGKRNSQLTKELNPNAPPYLRRRAEAILRVLSHGSISEIKIRQLIGNSPDTSKALRM